MEEKTTSVAQEFALLRSCLATIPDPRYPRGRVHPLEGVLSLSVLALMADCRSLSSIHRFGELHPQVLELLDLRRSPSVATLARLLRRVSVAQVAEALRSFVQKLLEGRYLGEPLVVAADGKTLRGVWEEGQQLGALHLFVHQAQLALDQVRTLYHVEEARATKTWLEELAGQFPGLAVLTGDALLADRDLCAAIVAQDQDYLVKLKKTNSAFMKR
jgi:hypothetical protein